NNRHTHIAGLTAFLALFLAWMWLRPEATDQVYQLSGNTMGTGYTVLVTRFPDEVPDNELAEGIEQRLHRIDRELMSTYAPESELSRFNRAPVGQWMDISPELADVMAQAQAVSDLTGGYFDVTVGPLVDRWGFGPLQEMADSSRIPTDAEIEQLRERVGYRHLEVNQQPPQLRKLHDVRVDLSGVAKGYGTDVIADYLESVGLDSYFIEIGGELRVRGVKPDGSSWVPAIERPTQGAPEVHDIIVHDGQSIAVAGSGDYRNYFEQDGVRFSHEIDPFTGRPISHDLAAVYVITDTAAMADAWSTAFMVMGAERSEALAQRLDLAAYFITKRNDGEGFDSRFTPQFARYLSNEDD
ncbi:MAG: FAD:protein FMN transferase, partial [Pseudohongiella sp.]